MKPEALGYHYIAVDGPIGVGKTTLVEMLTRRFEGVKILEWGTAPSQAAANAPDDDLMEDLE